MKNLCIFLLISFCAIGTIVKAQCPTFSISTPQGTVIGCVPPTISLTAVNTSTLSSITYTWTDPSLAVSNGSNMSFGLPGTYTVEAKDASSSCIVTNTISISQNTVAPGCTVTPVSGTITCSNPVTFTAISGPTTNIVGQWYDSFGVPISGVSGYPLIQNISSAGTYSAVFTDIANGCTSSQTVQVVGGSSAPSITIPPITTTIACSGSPVPATVTASSGPNTIGTWYLNSMPVTAPGNSSVTFTTTNPTTYTAVFTDTVTGCSNSATVAVPANSIVPTVSVLASSFSLSCTSGSIILSISGGSTVAPQIYTWTDLNLTPPITITVPTGAYTVSTAGYYEAGYKDGNVCQVSQQFYISSTATTPTISISGTNTVCLGSSSNLMASGATNYTWSTGASASSINVLPSANTTYTVTGGVGSCTNTSVYTVTVDPTCADVWPGDANSDGIVNNLDILELGVQSGYTGPARIITGNNWISCYSSSWAGTISNGKNRCHADCNGDGVVNSSDKLAVAGNFNQVHSFKPNESVPSNPDIYISPDQTSIVSGNWGSASVFVGNSANPLTNVYGLAFDITYNNNLIETDSVYITYTSSFLNSGNANIEFEKNIFTNGTNYAATVRTDHIAKTGYGKIASVYYKAKAGLNNDTVLNIGVVNGQKANSFGGLSVLSGGAATLTINNSAIGINEVEAFANSIIIFPQPASDIITISVKESITQLIHVTLYDMKGNEVLNKSLLLNNNRSQLSLNGIAAGVYTLHIKNSTGQTSVKKLVITR